MVSLAHHQHHHQRGQHLGGQNRMFTTMSKCCHMIRVRLTLAIEASILELNSSGSEQGFIHLARQGVGISRQ